MPAMKATPLRKTMYDLPLNEYSLVMDVRVSMGRVASASLECVLCDGAKRFLGIAPIEVELIKTMARARNVVLPVAV